MRKLLFISIYIIPLLFIFSCKGNEEVEPPSKIKNTQPQFIKEGELEFLKPDGSAVVKINIEIADTDADRQQGLMNRSFMSNERGMLFVFVKEEPQGFWMRNTIIPLDIIYVNSNKEIVSIAENTQPYSETSIPSKRPAIYVVEVNAGFCAQYSITAGFKINFARN